MEVTPDSILPVLCLGPLGGALKCNSVAAACQEQQEGGNKMARWNTVWQSAR